MLKFYRILLLTLVAVFIASAAGIARYAADSCTQTRMYRQLAAQTEKIPDDAVSTGNDFLPQYQALYAQNSDLAGWIQIDGTNINYPVMQSKHDPDFYLKHNFEKADSPHGCPYVQANCDLQTPSDNILVYGHNMKDGTMFSDLLQYKRESFWEQHRIIRFDTMTAQAEYTVMAVFRGEAEDLFAYYQCTDTETPQEFAAYVDACKNAALYETGVTAAYGDKLLSLAQPNGWWTMCGEIFTARDRKTASRKIWCDRRCTNRHRPHNLPRMPINKKGETSWKKWWKSARRFPTCLAAMRFPQKMPVIRRKKMLLAVKVTVFPPPR